MEELFVYALFMRIGFDVENEYDELLDKLFMNDPEKFRLSRTGNTKRKYFGEYSLHIHSQRYGIL